MSNKVIPLRKFYQLCGVWHGRNHSLVTLKLCDCFAACPAPYLLTACLRYKVGIYLQCIIGIPHITHRILHAAPICAENTVRLVFNADVKSRVLLHRHRCGIASIRHECAHIIICHIEKATAAFGDKAQYFGTGALKLCPRNFREPRGNARNIRKAYKTDDYFQHLRNRKRRSVICLLGLLVFRAIPLVILIFRSVEIYFCLNTRFREFGLARIFYKPQLQTFVNGKINVRKCQSVKAGNRNNTFAFRPAVNVICWQTAHTLDNGFRRPCRIQFPGNVKAKLRYAQPACPDAVSITPHIHISEFAQRTVKNFNAQAKESRPSFQGLRRLQRMSRSSKFLLCLRTCMFSGPS